VCGMQYKETRVQPLRSPRRHSKSDKPNHTDTFETPPRIPSVEYNPRLSPPWTLLAFQLYYHHHNT